MSSEKERSLHSRPQSRPLIKLSAAGDAILIVRQPLVTSDEESEFSRPSTSSERGVLTHQTAGARNKKTKRILAGTAVNAADEGFASVFADVNSDKDNDKDNDDDDIDFPSTMKSHIKQRTACASATTNKENKKKKEEEEEYVTHHDQVDCGTHNSSDDNNNNNGRPPRHNIPSSTINKINMSSPIALLEESDALLEAALAVISKHKQRLLLLRQAEEEEEGAEAEANSSANERAGERIAAESRRSSPTRGQGGGGGRMMSSSTPHNTSRSKSSDKYRSAIRSLMEEDDDFFLVADGDGNNGRVLPTSSTLRAERALQQTYTQQIRDELFSILKHRGEILEDWLLERLLLLQREEKKTRRKISLLAEIEAREQILRAEVVDQERLFFAKISEVRRRETFVPWCNNGCSYCCMSQPNWEEHIKKMKTFNAKLLEGAETRCRAEIEAAFLSHFFAITCSWGVTEQQVRLVSGQSEALRAEEYCTRGEVEVLWLKGYGALYAIHAEKKMLWDSKAYANDLRNKQIEVHREQERLHVAQVRASRQMTIVCTLDEVSRRDNIESLEGVKFQDLMNKFQYRYNELKAEEWRREVKTALLERDALLKFREDTIRERAEALEEAQKKQKIELEREFRELRKLRKAGAQDILPPCHRCHQIPAKDMSSHRLNECPERPTQCMKCEVIMPMSQSETHKDICPARVLQCQFCQNFFKAAYLEQVHTQSRCAAVKDAMVRLTKAVPTIRLAVADGVHELTDLDEFYSHAESLVMIGNKDEALIIEPEYDYNAAPATAASEGPTPTQNSSVVPVWPSNAMIAPRSNNNATTDDDGSTNKHKEGGIDVSDVSISLEERGGGRASPTCLPQHRRTASLPIDGQSSKPDKNDLEGETKNEGLVATPRKQHTATFDDDGDKDLPLGSSPQLHGGDKSSSKGDRDRRRSTSVVHLVEPDMPSPRVAVPQSLLTGYPSVGSVVQTPSAGAFVRSAPLGDRLLTSVDETSNNNRYVFTAANDNNNSSVRPNTSSSNGGVPSTLRPGSSLAFLSSPQALSRIPINATPAQAQLIQRIQVLLSTNPTAAEEVQQVFANLTCVWAPASMCAVGGEAVGTGLDTASQRLPNSGVAEENVAVSQRRLKGQTVVKIHTDEEKADADFSHRNRPDSGSSNNNKRPSSSSFAREKAIEDHLQNPDLNGSIQNTNNSAVNPLLLTSSPAALRQFYDNFTPAVSVNAIPVKLPSYISPFVVENAPNGNSVRGDSEGVGGSSSSNANRSGSTLTPAPKPSNASSSPTPITTTPQKQGSQAIATSTSQSSPSAAARRGLPDRSTSSSPPPQNAANKKGGQQTATVGADEPIIVTAADINTSSGVVAAPIQPPLRNKLHLSSAVNQPCGPLVLTGGLPNLVNTVNVPAAEVNRQLEVVKQQIAQTNNIAGPPSSFNQNHLNLLHGHQQGQGSSFRSDGSGGGGGGATDLSRTASPTSARPTHVGGGGGGGNSEETAVSPNIGTPQANVGLNNNNNTVSSSTAASGMSGGGGGGPSNSRVKDVHAHVYPPFLPLPPSAGSAVYVTHIDGKPISQWLKQIHVEHMQYQRSVALGKMAAAAAEANNSSATLGGGAPSIDAVTPKRGTGLSNSSKRGESSRRDSVASSVADTAGMNSTGARRGSVASSSVSNSPLRRINSMTSSSGALGTSVNSSPLPNVLTTLASHVSPAASLPPPSTFEELMKHISLRYAVGARVHIRLVATPGTTYHTVPTGRSFFALGSKSSHGNNMVTLGPNTIHPILSNNLTLNSARSQTQALDDGLHVQRHRSHGDAGEGGGAVVRGLSSSGRVLSSSSSSSVNLMSGLGDDNGWGSSPSNPLSGIAEKRRATAAPPPLPSITAEELASSASLPPMSARDMLTARGAENPTASSANKNKITTHGSSLVDRALSRSINSSINTTAAAAGGGGGGGFISPTSAMSTFGSPNSANTRLNGPHQYPQPINAAMAARVASGIGGGVHSVVFFPAAIAFDLTMLVEATETSSVEEYERLKFLVMMDTAQYCKPTTGQLAEGSASSGGAKRQGATIRKR